jgi:hypothetical protein
MIALFRKPLPGHTQQSRVTDIHVKAGFEPTISESQRPQIHVLDRGATGIISSLPVLQFKQYMSN